MRREYKWHNQKEDGLKQEHGLKRSTWKLDKPNFATCPHCHEPVMQHTACSNCGYYDGKKVMAGKNDENN